ncbi:hypothetical protein [Desulfolutivibrio sulfoxidireducens]|uniref:hypothetical protein n=1 Tax=Desulfolutivibrio sulfoxidireducens TaxID=2773299 RepID=UPI00159D4F03|nr:hypothetical protein [Desulfolutivibrio sulfoxidireducens]QLA17681.1 hypothetical protein GD605_17150 [Desulfolutivibrio sulfoxidireducens]QLA21256.1 hypothetical protein GD604_16760 [Desulfolutivibrio sulfoxidireducens]
MVKMLSGLSFNPFPEWRHPAGLGLHGNPEGGHGPGLGHGLHLPVVLAAPVLPVADDAILLGPQAMPPGVAMMDNPLPVG